MRVYIHSHDKVIPLNVTESETAEALITRLGTGEGQLFTNYKTLIPPKSAVSNFLNDHNDLFFKPNRILGIPTALTDYSWEDKERIVLVRIPLPKEIGTVDGVSADFQERLFDLLITAKNQQWRFKCPRTHGLIDPSKCAYKLANNSVTVTLGKLKIEPWFDVFKRKAIGDSDPM